MVLVINAYDNISIATILPRVDKIKKLLNGVKKNKIMITIEILIHIQEFLLLFK